MKILVKAKTKAKEEKVERMGQPTLGFNGLKENTQNAPETPSYKVSVKEAPEHGRANDAIARLLAKYFKITLSDVHLVSGQTSKQKIFDIEKKEL